MTRRSSHPSHRAQDGAQTPPAVEPEASEPARTQEEPPAEPSGAAEVESAEEAVSADIAEMQRQLRELSDQFEAARDQYLRTLADFQNFRRRTEEQKAELVRFANRELVAQLLPILDNFERAMSSASQSQNYEALMAGVTLTHRQLQEFLQKNGVTPIEAIGAEFDPAFHEAVMRVEDGEHPENTVVKELQRGYTMHGRVVRPSMVKVARSS